jgi:hypothetical protein
MERDEVARRLHSEPSEEDDGAALEAAVRLAERHEDLSRRIDGLANRASGGERDPSTSRDRAVTSPPHRGLAKQAAVRVGSAAAGVRLAAIKAARAVVNLDLDDVSLNPMAVVLGPVQRALGEHLVYARGLRAVIEWDDPMLTWWLCAVLLLLALLLPPLLLLLSTLPWVWLFRTFGAAALGPHMYCVGAARRREEHDAALLEERWQAARDEAEALDILKARVAADDARVEAEEERAVARAAQDILCDPSAIAGRAREVQASALLDGAQHTLELAVTPRFERRPARPQPWRSYADVQLHRAGDIARRDAQQGPAEMHSLL